MSKMSEKAMGQYAPDNEVVNSYFEWLCDLVDADKGDSTAYLLLKKLYCREFWAIVPNDDNRAVDGQKLRDEFAEDAAYSSYEALEGTCSILEMMIALARRIETMMQDSESKIESISGWFWMMIDNLGLGDCDDGVYFTDGWGAKIDKVCDILLERRYQMNGKGGLFPLNKKTRECKDQRKVEIWYQMCAYLLENYYVDGVV